MTVRVLFVCLGNICRSPLAEGILRHLVREQGLESEIEIDSAGTGGWHEGDPPDPRAREVARRHGVSLDGQRARKVRPEDLRGFDLILAMDRDNLEDLRAVAPPDAHDRIRLLRDFDPQGGRDVPDPYYGGRRGFEDVFSMIHRCCATLLDDLKKRTRS